VLFVSEKESKDSETTLEVTQSRFLSTGEDPSITTLWWVPVGVATPHGTTQQIIKEKTSTLTVKAGKNDWIKFNPDVTGFYRVRYTDELLNRLRRPIEALELSPTDRLGIQGDAFALARAGNHSPFACRVTRAVAHSSFSCVSRPSAHHACADPAERLQE
jgi:aminopeptidase N